MRAIEGHVHMTSALGGDLQKAAGVREDLYCTVFQNQMQTGGSKRLQISRTSYVHAPDEESGK